MSESPPPSDSPPHRPAAADSPAVLLVDATGRITHANHAAAVCWNVAAETLRGQLFDELFQRANLDPAVTPAPGLWAEFTRAAPDHEPHLTLLSPVSGFADETALPTVRVRVECLSADVHLATLQPSFPRPTSQGPDLRLLERLSESGGAGFFQLNLGSGQASYSATWKQLLGYRDAELPATLEAWRGLIHPDDSAAAPDRPGQKIASGSRPFDVEFRMRHRTGRWIWLHSVGLQLLAPDGSIEHVIGLHLDITERKELEEATFASDERLQLLSGAGPLGAFDLDFLQQTFWFSAGWKRTLGYDDEDSGEAATSLQAALPANEQTAGVETWLRLRAPGLTRFVTSEVLLGKDGRPVPVLLGIHRTLTRKRELARVVGFICRAPGPATPDLPAALVHAALDALAEGVLLTDAAGKIIHLNEAGSRLLGVKRDDVRDEPAALVFRLVPRESDQPNDDPFARALAATEPLPLLTDSALASREGGLALPIVWTARACRDASGRPEGVAVLFRNPAEVSLTPEEMMKANRFESLGAVAGGIAHDFNELLTTILGGISLAKDKRNPGALQESEEACLAAKGLTKQLLAFVKGGSGVHVVISPLELLGAPIKLAGAGSDAAITLEVIEGTPAVRVDRSQMVQVFQNLILNALQAMPGPPHRARVHLRAAPAQLAAEQIPPLPAGPYVEIEVRDNGSGIAPENLQKIFDPFFTTRKHRTGLGLATALSIVRKHEGQIGVVSTPGEGTAFTVFLPGADAPPPPAVQKAPSVRFRTGRILFMDDDAKVTALTAPMLESLDYRCDVARDGAEAIQCYQRYFNIGRPYDAVILDVTVTGGMGGEECFKALRDLDPDVRAIICTGYENDAMARRFIDQGFCGYLTKPYRTADLGQVLKAVLG